MDYVNNNISKSFNKQIKPFKGLNVDELVDSIREMVMTKFSIRRVIGRNLETSSLPSALKDLNAKSRLLGNAKSPEAMILLLKSLCWRMNLI